jgi:hypothetical protein
MSKERAREQRDLASEARTAALARWVFRTRPRGARDNCLERALVTYRYLGQAGAEPQLVVGMSKTDREVGHVWVVVDGQFVHDTRQDLERYVAFLVFDSDGSLLSTAPALPSGVRS